MSQPSQSLLRNRLLTALAPADYDVIRPHLERVEMPREMVLGRADHPADYVYFPERGVGSVVASSADGLRIEVRLFGRDGMSSIHTILGAPKADALTIMQVGGDGYRVELTAWVAAMAGSRSLHATMLLYVQTCITQSAYTALANGQLTIEERLARWLLMTHDRTDGDEVPLTHEFLSIMLGVRRSSVTEAIHMLEGRHLIKARRGLFTILDREGLVEFAAGTYGPPEVLYRELIGPVS